MAIFIAYFVYHAASAFNYSAAPFSLFALARGLTIIIFAALMGAWVKKRSSLGAGRQLSADLQMAAGLCFFTAAWQACGLVGAPGFAVYPELAWQLGNQSFLVGQALAVQLFIALGLVFLLWACASAGSKQPPDSSARF